MPSRSWELEVIRNTLKQGCQACGQGTDSVCSAAGPYILHIHSYCFLSSLSGPRFFKVMTSHNCLKERLTTGSFAPAAAVGPKATTDIYRPHVQNPLQILLTFRQLYWFSWLGCLPNNVTQTFISKASCLYQAIAALFAHL